LKVKKVVVSEALLLDFLTIGNKVRASEIVRGLPEGATIVRTDLTPEERIEIYVQHESFPEIPSGEEAPILEILVKSN